jgi:hypothetical protein
MCGFAVASTIRCLPEIVGSCSLSRVDCCLVGTVLVCASHSFTVFFIAFVSQQSEYGLLDPIIQKTKTLYATNYSSFQMSGLCVLIKYLGPKRLFT